MNPIVPRQGGRREAGYSMVELLVILVFIAIVASIAAQTALFAFDVARLGRSTANMRQVASAVMQYQSAQSALPGSGTLQPVSAIRASLGNQAGNIDVKDGWSHDLFYQQLTVNGSPTFRIYCFGKDGVPDGAITGVWVDFFSDVVFEGGSFIQTKW